MRCACAHGHRTETGGRAADSHADRQGVIAVLDSRVRSSIYGRQTVIPSLPPGKMAKSFADVSDFFNRRFAPTAEPPLTRNGQPNINARMPSTWTQ